ncbi:hypothetical protein Tco_0478381 [Tanacetum coccineum]
MQEDQNGSDSGKVHMSLAGPNQENMDDEFLATAYPKVHENLKLITDERVIEDNLESHSGSMFSMKNLEDTENFGDQFLYDKPTEDDQEKSKVAADIMKALKESKKMSKRQPGTGGSNKGTGECYSEWGRDVDSEHLDRDDNAGDDNEETKPDPEEIYNSGPAPSLMTPGYISSGLVQEYYNLPPRTVSPDPVAIVASRAVDPVGSPSSTTIDQDEQSLVTSPTNQEIQSQVTHQGPVPQFMAPDHSSSGPVLHEMTSDQIDYDISGPVPPRKNVVSLADKIDLSQKEMKFLFNHLFEEYFSPTNVHAEENNNDQAANASL